MVLHILKSYGQRWFDIKPTHSGRRLQIEVMWRQMHKFEHKFYHFTIISYIQVSSMVSGRYRNPMLAKVAAVDVYCCTRGKANTQENMNLDLSACHVEERTGKKWMIFIRGFFFQFSYRSYLIVYLFLFQGSLAYRVPPEMIALIILASQVFWSY